MEELLLGFGAAFALQIFFVVALLGSGWSEGRWARAGDSPGQLDRSVRAKERERRNPREHGQTGSKAA
ncbi:MAG TPA: hypothetical protein VHI54_09525 [Actinomycetota bacterium]|nr:hypothetical protein [Actinomycetota bacterium]